MVTVLRIYKDYPKVKNVLAKNVFHDIVVLLLSFTFFSIWGCADEFKTDKSVTILSLLSISVFSLSNCIARFIWNAEISVSVAIHCYECLF